MVTKDEESKSTKTGEAWPRAREHLHVHVRGRGGARLVPTRSDMKVLAHIGVGVGES